MQLKINIKEDKELRDSIKKMIEEQVKGLTRKAFDEVLLKEIARKANNIDEHQFNRILVNVHKINTQNLKYIANKEIEKRLAEDIEPLITIIVEKIVEKQLEQSIKKVIEKISKKEVNKKVEEKIKGLLK